MTKDIHIENSVYLYIDLIIVSAGGWFFWFVISKITTPSEIGYATTVISLISLVWGFLGFGLEFSLLKNATRKGVFSSILSFELIILAIMTIPVFLIGVSIYGDLFSNYMVWGIILLFSVGLQFTSRYTILGALKSSQILIYDLIGICGRFVIGIILVFWGLGGQGILIATSIQSLIVGLGLLFVIVKIIDLGFVNWVEFKSLLKHGMSNLPGKIAQLTIMNLSLIMLAVYVSNPETVGIYYMALMISQVAGGFATSLATMSIPSSNLEGEDSSKTSLRLGFVITAPLIAAVLSNPSFVLSVIGETYTAASEQLQFLALSVLSSILVINEIAYLNSNRDLKKLVFIGTLQLISFLVPFTLLINDYGGIGASISVLISSLTASIPSGIWLGRKSIKPILTTIIAVSIGWGIGSQASLISPFLGVILALLSSSLIIIALGEISPREIKDILQSIKYKS